jgi:hypothetical protein
MYLFLEVLHGARSPRRTIMDVKKKKYVCFGWVELEDSMPDSCHWQFHLNGIIDSGQGRCSHAGVWSTSPSPSSYHAITNALRRLTRSATWAICNPPTTFAHRLLRLSHPTELSHLWIQFPDITLHCRSYHQLGSWFSSIPLLNDYRSVM